MEGYQKENLTLDYEKAMRFTKKAFIIITIVFGLSYYLYWELKEGIAIKAFIDSIEFLDFLYFFIFILATLFVSYLAFTLALCFLYACYARSFKAVGLTYFKELHMLYGYCKKPLKVKQYISCILIPMLVFGLIPCIIAIVVGSLWLLLFGVILLISAAANLLTINRLRKEPKSTLVLDNPSEIGCFIYRKQEVSI